MVTIYDVPPGELVAKLAVRLKEMDSIKPPEWADFVKTGRHAEKAPVQEDWWFTRAASVLRKVYIEGPIGTERLAATYGGFADRGSKPNRAVRGSRSIARKCLMQLETNGFVAKDKNRGRIITAKGRGLLDKVAMEVHQESKKS